MTIGLVAQTLLRRSLILQAAGVAVTAGSAAYYFTHPQRIVAELPSDLRQQAVDVTLAARDGARLHATWLPGQDGGTRRPFDRTIVQHHGFNSSSGVILARKAFYQRGVIRLPGRENGEPLLAWSLVRAGLARGYNFLLVDARAHGRSGGRWDTTGRLALADLADWVKWLREVHGQLWAGLWGQSFGASLGLALATRPAGGGIDAMVLDSPAVMAQGLYAGVVHKPFYYALQPVLQQLANKDLPQQLAAAHVWMPILLIHGQADTHVPVWQSEHAYGLIHDPARPERTDLWLVPGADHLEALEVAQEPYVRRTLAWFDQWM